MASELPCLRMHVNTSPHLAKPPPIQQTVDKTALMTVLKVFLLQLIQRKLRT